MPIDEIKAIAIGLIASSAGIFLTYTAVKKRRWISIAFSVAVLALGTLLLVITASMNSTPAKRALRFAASFSKNGSCKEAYKHYEAATQLDPQLSEAFNNWAWALLACKEKSLRDPARALAIARKLPSLPGFKKAYADTLACALAENRLFDEAIQLDLKYDLSFRKNTFLNHRQCQEFE